jgi:Txe/YoeB family toxin of toxin-antitoxin system
MAEIPFRKLVFFWMLDSSEAWMIYGNRIYPAGLGRFGVLEEIEQLSRSKKIRNLIESISETLYEGIGKPEPLKYMLAGCWSRRINNEHRIVYKVVIC